MKRLPFNETHPHYVTLPKGSVSPTNSIYKTHDIVKQASALWATEGSKTLRCIGPFTVLVKVGSKVREIESRTK